MYSYGGNHPIIHDFFFMQNFSYPVGLTIQPQQLYHLSIEDGAKDFIVRIHHNFQYFPFSIKKINNKIEIGGLDESLKSFEKIVPLVFSEIDSVSLNGYISHNNANAEISPVKNALKILYEKTDEEPLAYTYISYLLLLNNFVDKGWSMEFMDIVYYNNDNVYKHLTHEQRLTLMKSLVGDNKEAAVLGSDEQFSFFSQPVYKKFTREELPYMLESFINEYDNIYYKIEISGNETYILYHPYLEKIRELTGIDLTTQLNPKEQISYRRMLQEA